MVQHVAQFPLLSPVAAIDQHVAEAVAKEREGCAKACEDVATTRWDEYAASYNSAVFDCAAAIRARAEKETSNER